jgi:hypothetical protein
MYGYNIYYSPEKFGLRVVAEIEYSDRNYQFDTRVVWKEINGEKLFTMRDSGCSCPTPFEDYRLDNIDKLNFKELRREVACELLDKFRNISPSEAESFLETVRGAL